MINKNNRKKYYFIFYKDEILLERITGTDILRDNYTIPLSEEPPVAVKPWTVMQNVTPLNDIDVCTYSIDSLPSYLNRFEICPLRQSYYKLPYEMYMKAGKCAELLYWDRNTRFCGVCGGMMKFHTDISKRCEHCGKEVWPQLATAIIVLIRRGDEVLLARGRNFKTDFYGLIAGFVETGETLEEAVEREVMEETGIKIKNIHYFGSQPWPYPCGLMVGFNAEYESGELHIQREELKKAGWFRRDNLPNIPEKLSIARKLIDAWIEKDF